MALVSHQWVITCQKILKIFGIIMPKFSVKGDTVRLYGCNIYLIGYGQILSLGC